LERESTCRLFLEKNQIIVIKTGGRQRLPFRLSLANATSTTDSLAPFFEDDKVLLFPRSVNFVWKRVNVWWRM
jgi:hypothetical protein